MATESQEVSKQFEDAKSELADYRALQAEVDRRIAALSPNDPRRIKAETMRDETRSWFDDYIIPAWEGVTNAVSSYFGALPSTQNFSALPTWTAFIIGPGTIAYGISVFLDALEEGKLKELQIRDLLPPLPFSGYFTALKWAKWAAIGGAGIYAGVWVFNTLKPVYLGYRTVKGVKSKYDEVRGLLR